MILEIFRFILKHPLEMHSKVIDSVTDSVLIRENTGQRKSVLWKICEFLSTL